MTDDYDSPWKDILERYFAQFMAFFFPEAYADIDWSKGYESLDTELQQIVRDAESGKRLADKLIKVHRRDGVEQIVLIHIEIQGEADAVASADFDQLIGQALARLGITDDLLPFGVQAFIAFRPVDIGGE